MKLARHLAMLSALLLVCTCTYTVTAQDGCNMLSSTNGLINGAGTTDMIPANRANTLGELRSQVGGRGVSPWALFSATQVQQHGLWCQVNSASNGGMGSNIGDMFYPTGDGPDGFTVAPTSDTSNNVPYQQLECTNQIGIIVDGDVTNNQGIVKCNTTIPNLNRDTNYWVVYSTNVFNGYSGPTVGSNMTLSILSSRDADPNLEYSLSFTVSYGPPSRITCTRDGAVFINNRREPNPALFTRDVIRSRYISSTQPDMTRVTVRPDPQSRIGATYACTVFVEGRTGINSGPYDFDQLGSRSTTVTVTVAGTPTAVSVTRTATTNVRVTWTAPSTGPALGGYEVFYQTGSTVFSSSTQLTLTGLVVEQAYSIFVVAFGPDGAPVLPSARSNTATITLGIQPTNLMLSPSSTSIMISWTAPQLSIPDNYSVSVGCSRLCNSNIPTALGMQVVPGEGATTSYTVTGLDPGNVCDLRVIAAVGSVSRQSDVANTLTLTAAPTGAPGTLTNTLVESRSLTVVWGTVPCPDQRGPITGYRLRYNSMMVDLSGQTNTQHVLTGLTPFTSYSVQVVAVNAGGTGPYSDPALTVETLQDVPGPVSDLSATPGVVQLTISWSPPSEPNVPITIYQISYSTGVEFNTSATQHTLRDLPPNTVVVFSVRAYTIVGPGENVTDQASTTSVPRVTGVIVVALNSTAVNVSWTPVTLLDTEYHYTVHYTGVKGTKHQSISGSVNVSAGSSSGVVGGLMTGEQYQFSVSITVSDGAGNIYTGAMSNLTDPFTLPRLSSEAGPVVAAVIIVVLLLVVAAVVTIVIVVVLLRSRKVTSKSSHNSLAIYDIPDQQTSEDIKMAECAAYGGIYQTQQKPSNDTGVYEQIFTTN